MTSYLLLFCTLVTLHGVKTDTMYKLDTVQYHNMTDSVSLLEVGLWLTEEELDLTLRYRPEEQNRYLLYTRQNPLASHQLVLGDTRTVRTSAYCPRRTTALLIHGWKNNATSDFFATVVPAYLAAKDVNVIVVDWSAGADTLYGVAVLNTVTSGKSVARFVTWLNSVTGASLSDYHIVGHSLGGQQTGVVGRNLGGRAGYITALDPAQPGWLLNKNRLRADDAQYTEVIHTNAGFLGFRKPLGDVDFYPNGGINMAGCISAICDHVRSYVYFAESLVTGGFMGTACSSYRDAMDGNCNLRYRLNMGGIYPKTGHHGVFYLKTNPDPPFSKNKGELKLFVELST